MNAIISLCNLIKKRPMQFILIITLIGLLSSIAIGYAADIAPDKPIQEIFKNSRTIIWLDNPYDTLSNDLEKVSPGDTMEYNKDGYCGTLTRQETTESKQPAVKIGTVGNRTKYKTIINYEVTFSGQVEYIPKFTAGPNVTSVKDNSATLTWSTDIETKAEIWYWVSGHEPQYVLCPDVKKTQTIEIAGLVSGITYQYEIVVLNGKQGSSFKGSFTTKTPTIPKFTAGPNVTSVKDNSATLTWSTDIETKAEIWYWVSGYEPQYVLCPDVKKTQTIEIPGLVSGRTYQYEIIVSNGNQSASSKGSFTTVIYSNPEFTSSPRVDVTFNSAMISWETDVSATADIWYWPEGVINKEVLSIKESKKAQSITIPNLDSRKTYKFQISAITSTGSKCFDGRFTTLSPIAATGVTLDPSNLELQPGTAATLKANVLPGNVTNKEVVWSSNNTNVATVSNGMVTALKDGTAVITVKTKDGNYQATCSVNVKTLVPQGTFDLAFNSDLILDADYNETVALGENVTFISHITNLTNDKFTGRFQVKFEVSDGTVLYGNIDSVEYYPWESTVISESGKWTPKKEGVYTVTVVLDSSHVVPELTRNNNTKVFKVKVISEPYEPKNDHMEGAAPISFGMQPNENTFHNNDDVDYWYFDVTKDETNVSNEFKITRPVWNKDAKSLGDICLLCMTLKDSSGRTLDISIDSAPVIRYRAPKPGRYYLKIFAFEESYDPEKPYCFQANGTPVNQVVSSIGSEAAGWANYWSYIEESFMHVNASQPILFKFGKGMDQVWGNINGVDITYGDLVKGVDLGQKGMVSGAINAWNTALSKYSVGSVFSYTTQNIEYNEITASSKGNTDALGTNQVFTFFGNAYFEMWLNTSNLSQKEILKGDLVESGYRTALHESQNVIIHELGHVLGLSDLYVSSDWGIKVNGRLIDNTDKIMYYTNGSKANSIHPNEIYGVAVIQGWEKPSLAQSLNNASADLSRLKPVGDLPRLTAAYHNYNLLDLYQKSAVIVRGTVQSVYDNPRDPNDNFPTSTVILAATEYYKDNTGKRNYMLSLVADGDSQLQIGGNDLPMLGKEYILFLKQSENGTLYICGGPQGRFDIVQDDQGIKWAQNHENAVAESSLAGNGISASDQCLKLEDFESKIKSIVKELGATAPVEENGNNDGVIKEYPIVQTAEAANIQETVATLRGSIDSGPSPIFARYGFFWGTDPGDLGTPVLLNTDKGVTNTELSYKLEGLQSNTTYYFYAFVEMPNRLIIGRRMSFQTSATVPSKEIKMPMITSEGPWDGNIFGPGDMIRIGVQAENCDYFETFMNGICVNHQKVGDEYNAIHFGNQMYNVAPGVYRIYSVAYKDGFSPVKTNEVTIKVLGAGFKISGYVVKPDPTSSNYSYKAGFQVELTGDLTMKTVTDANGYFQFNNISSGTYQIRISKVGYLTRTITIKLLTKDLQLGSLETPLEMWAGDLPINGSQDGVINMSDIMELSKCFNTAVGNPKYNASYDFSGDGAINMQDLLLIMAKHFNQKESDYPTLGD